MGACTEPPASRPMPLIPAPFPPVPRRPRYPALQALAAALVVGSASVSATPAGAVPSAADAAGNLSTRPATSALPRTPAPLDVIEQRLQQTPQDASLRFSQARLLEAAGRPDEAVRAWERMTQDFPQLAEPFNNLAVHRAASGDLDIARTLLEQALLRDPDYRLARLNLAEVLLALAHRATCLAADPITADGALTARLQALAALRGVDAICPEDWRATAAVRALRPAGPSMPR